MCAYGSGAALFYFNRAWRTDIRTDSHMMTWGSAHVTCTKGAQEPRYNPETNFN